MHTSGYAVSPMCPLCGVAQDTVHHRLWHCQHPEVVEARRQAASPAIIKRAMATKHWDLTFTRGLYLNPQDMAKRPSRLLEIGVTDGEGARLEIGDIKLTGDVCLGWEL